MLQVQYMLHVTSTCSHSPIPGGPSAIANNRLPVQYMLHVTCTKLLNPWGPFRHSKQYVTSTVHVTCYMYQTSQSLGHLRHSKQYVTSTVHATCYMDQTSQSLGAPPPQQIICYQYSTSTCYMFHVPNFPIPGGTSAIANLS